MKTTIRTHSTTTATHAQAASLGYFPSFGSFFRLLTSTPTLWRQTMAEVHVHDLDLTDSTDEQTNERQAMLDAMEQQLRSGKFDLSKFKPTPSPTPTYLPRPKERDEEQEARYQQLVDAHYRLQEANAAAHGESPALAPLKTPKYEEAARRGNLPFNLIVRAMNIVNDQRADRSSKEMVHAQLRNLVGGKKGQESEVFDDGGDWAFQQRPDFATGRTRAEQQQEVRKQSGKIDKMYNQLAKYLTKRSGQQITADALQKWNKKASPEQFATITSDGRVIVLNAGPGSGKSTSMAQYILYDAAQQLQEKQRNTPDRVVSTQEFEPAPTLITSRTHSATEAMWNVAMKRLGENKTPLLQELFPTWNLQHRTLDSYFFSKINEKIEQNNGIRQSPLEYLAGLKTQDGKPHALSVPQGMRPIFDLTSEENRAYEQELKKKGIASEAVFNSIRKKYEEVLSDYMARIYQAHGIFGKENPIADAIQYIEEAKSDRAGVYTNAIRSGEQQFKSGKWNESKDFKVSPDVLLYLYESTLKARKGFEIKDSDGKVLNQQPRYDIADAPELYRRAAKARAVQPLQRVAVDEYEDLAPSHIHALHAGLHPTQGRIIFGGDMSQMAIQRDWHVGNIIKQTFGAENVHDLTLTGNYRSGPATVAFLNALNAPRVLVGKPTSPMQVSMRSTDRDIYGLDIPTFAYHQTEGQMYDAMIADWMKHIGINPHMMRESMEKGESPFAQAMHGRTIEATPFIVQMHQQTGDIQKAWAKTLKPTLGEDLTSQFLRDYVHTGVPDEVSAGKVHIGTLGKVRGRDVDDAFIDMRRGGKWQFWQYIQNMIVMSSRVRGVNHFYGSSEGVGKSTAFTMNPSTWLRNIMPWGMAQLAQGMLEDMVRKQSVDLKDLPTEWSAAYNPNKSIYGMTAPQAHPEVGPTEAQRIQQDYIESVIDATNWFQKSELSTTLTNAEGQGTRGRREDGEDSNELADDLGLRVRGKATAANVSGQYRRDRASGDNGGKGAAGERQTIRTKMGDAVQYAVRAFENLFGRENPSINPNLPAPDVNVFLHDAKSLMAEEEIPAFDLDMPAIHESVTTPSWYLGSGVPGVAATGPIPVRTFTPVEHPGEFYEGPSELTRSYPATGVARPGEAFPLLAQPVLAESTLEPAPTEGILSSEEARRNETGKDDRGLAERYHRGPEEETLRDNMTTLLQMPEVQHYPRLMEALHHQMTSNGVIRSLKKSLKNSIDEADEFSEVRSKIYADLNKIYYPLDKLDTQIADFAKKHSDAHKKENLALADGDPNKKVFTKRQQQTLDALKQHKSFLYGKPYNQIQPNDVASWSGDAGAQRLIDQFSNLNHPYYDEKLAYMVRMRAAQVLAGQVKVVGEPDKDGRVQEQFLWTGRNQIDPNLLDQLRTFAEERLSPIAELTDEQLKAAKNRQHIRRKRDMLRRFISQVDAYQHNPDRIVESKVGLPVSQEDIDYYKKQNPQEGRLTERLLSKREWVEQPDGSRKEVVHLGELQSFKASEKALNRYATEVGVMNRTDTLQNNGDTVEQDAFIRSLSPAVTFFSEQAHRPFIDPDAMRASALVPDLPEQLPQSFLDQGYTHESLLAAFPTLKPEQLRELHDHALNEIKERGSDDDHEFESWGIGTTLDNFITRRKEQLARHEVMQQQYQDHMAHYTALKQLAQEQQERYEPMRPQMHEELTRYAALAQRGDVHMTPEQVETYQQQVQQATALRDRLSNPDNQMQWAHTLRAVLRATTGEEVMDRGVNGEAKSDPIREFLKNRTNDFRNGKRTLESMQDMVYALSEATDHMARTGTLKYSHVTNILRAFGHDPEDDRFSMLHALEVNGFKPKGEGQDAELSLHKLAGSFPMSMQERTRAELTRSPLQQGRYYVFDPRGSMTGYQRNGGQADFIGMVGTIVPHNRSHFGSANTLTHSRAMKALNGEEAARYNLKDYPDNSRIADKTWMQPLFRFIPEGQNAEGEGGSFLVRADQLRLATEFSQFNDPRRQTEYHPLPSHPTAGMGAPDTSPVRPDANVRGLFPFWPQVGKRYKGKDAYRNFDNTRGVYAPWTTHSGEDRSAEARRKRFERARPVQKPLFGTEGYERANNLRRTRAQRAASANPITPTSVVPTQRGTFSYSTGDIFESGMQTLVNPVNLKGVMGKGLALQMKNRFPGLMSAYKNSLNVGQLAIGRPSLEQGSFDEKANLHPFDNKGTFILNFPTKDDWRQPSQLSYIEEGMKNLASVAPYAKKLGIKSIAFPKLGAGEGGLNWNDVGPIMAKHVAPLLDVGIHVQFHVGPQDTHFMPPDTEAPIPAQKSEIRFLSGGPVDDLLVQRRVPPASDGMSTKLLQPKRDKEAEARAYDERMAQILRERDTNPEAYEQAFREGELSWADFPLDDKKAQKRDYPISHTAYESYHRAHGLLPMLPLLGNRTMRERVQRLNAEQGAREAESSRLKQVSQEREALLTEQAQAARREEGYQVWMAASPAEREEYTRHYRNRGQVPPDVEGKESLRTRIQREIHKEQSEHQQEWSNQYNYYKNGNLLTRLRPIVRPFMKETPRTTKEQRDARDAALAELRANWMQYVQNVYRGEAPREGLAQRWREYRHQRQHILAMGTDTVTPPRPATQEGANQMGLDTYHPYWLEKSRAATRATRFLNDIERKVDPSFQGHHVVPTLHVERRLTELERQREEYKKAVMEQGTIEGVATTLPEEQRVQSLPRPVHALVRWMNQFKQHSLSSIKQEKQRRAKGAELPPHQEPTVEQTAPAAEGEASVSSPAASAAGNDGIGIPQEQISLSSTEHRGYRSAPEQLGQHLRDIREQAQRVKQYQKEQARIQALLKGTPKSLMTIAQTWNNAADTQQRAQSIGMVMDFVSQGLGADVTDDTMASEHEEEEDKGKARPTTKLTRPLPRVTQPLPVWETHSPAQNMVRDLIPYHTQYAHDAALFGTMGEMRTLPEGTRDLSSQEALWREHPRITQPLPRITQPLPALSTPPVITSPTVTPTPGTETVESGDSTYSPAQHHLFLQDAIRTPVPLKVSDTLTLKPLSKEQREIIDSDAHSHLIQGGPGAGKSKTIGSLLLSWFSGGKDGTEPLVQPNKVFSFSSMRSGKEALNRMFAENVTPLLPSVSHIYNLPKASTYASLAHRVLFPLDENRQRDYSILQGIGKGHVKDWLVDPEDAEQRLGETPQEYKRRMMKARAPLLQRGLERLAPDGVKRPSEYEMEQALEYISKTKKSQGQEGTVDYETLLAQGEQDLGAGMMTHDAMLAGFHHQMIHEGYADFDDAPDMLTKALQTFGVNALPTNMRDAQVLAIDEFQGNSPAWMKAFQAVKDVLPTNPRFIFAGDPFQGMFESLGDFKPEEVLKHTTNFLANQGMPFKHTKLTENFRGNLRSIAMNNSFLMHSHYKDVGAVPQVMSAATIEKLSKMTKQQRVAAIGTPDEMLFGKTEVSLNKGMLLSMLKHTGVSPDVIKKNIEAGKHPFEGVNFEERDAQGKKKYVAPRDIPLMSLMKSQHKFFREMAPEVLQERLGVSRKKAQQAARQMFHVGAPDMSSKKHEDLSKFSVGTVGQFRGLEFLYPHILATRVGGWVHDEQKFSYLQNMGVALSRVKAEGKNIIGATARMLTPGQRQGYLAGRTLDEQAHLGLFGGEVTMQGERKPIIPTDATSYGDLKGNLVPNDFFAELLAHQQNNLTDLLKQVPPYQAPASASVSSAQQPPSPPSTPTPGPDAAIESFDTSSLSAAHPVSVAVSNHQKSFTNLRAFIPTDRQSLAWGQSKPVSVARIENLQPKPETIASSPVVASLASQKEMRPIPIAKGTSPAIYHPGLRETMHRMAISRLQQQSLQQWRQHLGQGAKRVLNFLNPFVGPNTPRVPRSLYQEAPLSDASQGDWDSLLQSIPSDESYVPTATDIQALHQMDAGHVTQTGKHAPSASTPTPAPTPTPTPTPQRPGGPLVGLHGVQPTPAPSTPTQPIALNPLAEQNTGNAPSPSPTQPVVINTKDAHVVVSAGGTVNMGNIPPLNPPSSQGPAPAPAPASVQPAPQAQTPPIQSTGVSLANAFSAPVAGIVHVTSPVSPNGLVQGKTAVQVQNAQAQTPSASSGGGGGGGHQGSSGSGSGSGSGNGNNNNGGSGNGNGSGGNAGNTPPPAGGNSRQRISTTRTIQNKDGSSTTITTTTTNPTEEQLAQAQQNAAPSQQQNGFQKAGYSVGSFGHTMARVAGEYQYMQQLFGDLTTQAATQGSEYRRATLGMPTAGNDGTSGFYDFTNAKSGISQLQNHVPMFSKTEIAQVLRTLSSGTGNTNMNQLAGGAQDVLDVSALTGLDNQAISNQYMQISGYAGQGQNMAMGGHVAGMIQGMYGGPLTAANYAPTMDAFSALLPQVQGLTYGANTQQNETGIMALLTAGLKGGMTAANMPDMASALSTVAGMGTNPNLQQQYLLSQLYGPQHLTADTSLVEYQQQQASQQEDIKQLSLQQQMNVPGLKIQIAQADIAAEKANLDMSQLQQDYGVASYNQNLAQQNALYGPIGADTGRSTYFNFMRSQQAAGYNPLSAEAGTSFKDNGVPMGVENASFYAGIENQRTMLTLQRSPLLADAAYQQQMKYLNEQEAFYQQELKIRNDQRKFDQDWQKKLLDQQQTVLDIQKKRYALDVLMNTYQQASLKLDQEYLPQQLDLLKQLITAEQQQIKGQGPLVGLTPTPMDILRKLSEEKDPNVLKQDINTITSDPTQRNTLFQMVQGIQKAGGLDKLMKETSANANDKKLQQQVNQYVKQGATIDQQTIAAMKDAFLNFAGTKGTWQNFVNAFNTANNNWKSIAQNLSGTATSLKKISDFLAGAGPALMILATGVNTISMGMTAMGNILSILGRIAPLLATGGPISGAGLAGGVASVALPVGVGLATGAIGGTVGYFSKGMQDSGNPWWERGLGYAGQYLGGPAAGLGADYYDWQQGLQGQGVLGGEKNVLQDISHGKWGNILGDWGGDIGQQWNQLWGNASPSTGANAHKANTSSSSHGGYRAIVGNPDANTNQKATTDTQTSALTAIRDFFDKTFPTWWTSTITPKWNSLMNWLENQGKSIGQWFQTQWKNVTDFAQTQWKNVTDFAQTQWQNVTKQVQTIWSDISTSWQNDISKPLAAWAGGISDWWNKNVSKPLSDFTSSLKNMFNFGGNGNGGNNSNPIANLFSWLTGNNNNKNQGGGPATLSGPSGSPPGFSTPHVNTPFHQPMWYGELHQGIDFAADQGTPISFFDGGKVKASSFQPWGGEVDVDIGGGLIERYLHLSAMLVTVGQEVKRGQLMGLTGGGTPQSGYGYWSKGPHSHVQIDENNINAGLDPWPIWAMMGDSNISSYYGAGALGPSGPTVAPGFSPGTSSAGRGITRQGAGGGGGHHHLYAAQESLPREHLWTGGIVMSPTHAALGENGPEAVVPLSKLADVLKSSQSGSGASGSVATQSAGPKTSLSIQNLVNTMNVTVNPQNGTISDTERDEIASEIFDILTNALQHILGKID